MFNSSNLSIRLKMTTLGVAILMFAGIFALTTSVAKADLVTDLQSQIAALMAQIALLQGQTPVSTPVATASSSSVFYIGAPVVVTAPLKVRVASGINSTFIATQPIGATGTIVEGPILKDGFNWYKVDYSAGTDGWNIGAWLRNRTDLPDILGTYIGYLNGLQFIKTENLSRNNALANCKLNTTSNPTATVRCTWKGAEISALATSSTPTIVEASGTADASFITAKILFNTTKAVPSLGSSSFTIGYINWGDGSAVEKVNEILFKDVMLITRKHTYSNNGTYTIKAIGIDGKTTTKNITISIFPLPPQSQSIKVTAPNGGEAWEIGVTNTVTWAPYSYAPDVNPSKDVTAYLETKNTDGSFKTLGKVQESGKASIHWPTGELNSLTLGGDYAPAGRGYYIRIVNNITGATDRSDKPFTLLPKPVDLKVNGSDGPVNIGTSEKVTLSWKTVGVHDCQLQNAYTDSSRTTQIGAVAGSGSIKGYLHTDPTWGPTLYCTEQTGNNTYDSVKRTAPVINTEAVVKVISPNGGENFDPNKPVTIKYIADGISTMSVGLYKNDQWKAWIKKDLSVQTDPEPAVTFIPNKLVENLGEADNSGAIFKIYITGQLSAGIGYTDDKSDASFSFNSAAVVDSYPGKNIFGCNQNLRTGVSNGSLACYGMWDYGEAFGGDHYMCGGYTGKTDCVIKTPICTSGSAKATTYYDNSQLQTGMYSTNASPLTNSISSNLKVGSSLITKGVAGLWEYTCIPSTAPTGTVLGASTDIYSEMTSTLLKLSETLRQLIIK